MKKKKIMKKKSNKDVLACGHVMCLSGLGLDGLVDGVLHCFAFDASCHLVMGVLVV